MNRSICVWLAAAFCTALGAARADSPLLYLPLDGTPHAALSASQAVPQTADAQLEFHPGVRGQAAFINRDLRCNTAGCFQRESGTIAFWIRPAWNGTDTTFRSLFSLYGGRATKQPWRENRYSIVAGKGELKFWLWGSRPEQRWEIRTPIADWHAGQWHHVAVCWSGINAGEMAEGRLYVDGKCVGRATLPRLDVGPVAETFDIGRDSDNSPDYAEADYDEFYIYGQALTDAEIGQAVALARQADVVAAEPIPAGQPRGDWWNDAWPFRCRATVSADEATSDHTVVRLAGDFSAELHALGLRAAVDPASLRVVPCDATTGKCPPTAQPLACLFESGTLSWQMPAGSQHGPKTSFEIYFDVTTIDTTVPLWARPRRRAWQPQTEVNLIEPDYARDTYGKAWDFNRDGDFEGIDAWGNRPEYIRNRQVKDGVLSLDVSQDPYFIWGNMWSETGKTHRPVAIDLEKYPILKMRVRQSCSHAEWKLYGRADSPELMGYTFPVIGTGWQTIRIDLRHEASWAGVLKALRINATSKIASAHVEIDWVSLTNELLAGRSPVQTLGRPAREPASLAIELARQAADCTARQTVAVVARDAAGAPVANLPLTVQLKTNRDGMLLAHESMPSLAIDPSSRRGLTDPQGRVLVVLQSSRRAGAQADRLRATADFRDVVSPEVAVAAQAGPPHHLEVTPRRGATIDENRFPLPVRVQVVDQYDNPLPLAGRRVRLSAEDARLDPVEVTTAAEGSAKATLHIEPQQRWVYAIEATDASGLTGRSGRITLALKSARPAPVRKLPNGYFARGGELPFVPLGGFYANWVQLETPDGEWGILKSFTDTTDEQKIHWMKFLHDNGTTAMRLMLRTHRADGMEPMDVGGRVNQPLLAEVLHYLDLARRFDLQFQVVLHDDYTKPVYFDRHVLQRYALPLLAADEPVELAPEQARFLREQRMLAPIGSKYTDPDAMACQDRYVRELLPALRNCPQLFAYELENEMVACPASWAQHALATIRALDPATPACVSHGGGGLHTADPLWWHRNAPLDFYSYHLYPQENSTSAEIDYGAAVDVLARYGRMSGSCFLGESSGDQFRTHPSVATRRRVMRDIIWLALTKGNPGVFFWNARGPEVREFRVAQQAMAQLDLVHFRRAVPEIGIDVRHPLENDRWFRSGEGRSAYAMMGRYAQHYLDAGVDFDFTVAPQPYARHADLSQFSPPEPQQRPFTLSHPGWQLSYLAQADYDELLVYVRNFAGVDQWQCTFDRSRWTQYLRKYAAGPLRVQWKLPGAGYRLTLYDLESQESTTRDAAAHETLDLGTTDRDYVLVFKRR